MAGNSRNNLNCIWGAEYGDDCLCEECDNYTPIDEYDDEYIDGFIVNGHSEFYREWLGMMDTVDDGCLYDAMLEGLYIERR